MRTTWSCVRATAGSTWCHEHEMDGVAVDILRALHDMQDSVRRGREGNAETRGKKTVRGEYAADEQQALPDCLRDACFPLSATQPCGCEWSAPQYPQDKRADPGQSCGAVQQTTQSNCWC